MPRVTVLLPTYQSEKYLRETLESIFSQSFQDFEVLIVDDHSTDDTLKIIQSFADSRVRLLSGPQKGLAEALNCGMCQAAGEYIARIDADDLMVPSRLEKQVAYMDSHPEVAVCGGWQQYFGLSTYLHAPPEASEQCRANLLFRCDLCHSTLMLRRDVFLGNSLFYDDSFAAEDFELWTRVLDHGEISNLPEVLGYYREDGRSITTAKKEQLIVQQGEIVAATLKRNLNIELTPAQTMYFRGWINPFFDTQYGPPIEERESAWRDLSRILAQIYERNREAGYYDEKALLKALAAEWAVLRYNAPFELPREEIPTLESVFVGQKRSQVLLRKALSFCRNYRGIRRKYWKLKSLLDRRQKNRHRGER